MVASSFIVRTRNLLTENSKSNWIKTNSNAEISFLFEDPDFKSLFIKLPKGYAGKIESTGSTVHAVVIKGDMKYTMPNEEEKLLDVGSYFGASSRAMHPISNDSEGHTILYIRTNAEILVK